MGYGTEPEHLAQATATCDDLLSGREKLVRRRGGTELYRAKWRWRVGSRTESSRHVRAV